MPVVALPNPGDGTMPTYNDADNRQPGIIAASAVGTLLAILSTVGRIAARRRRKASLSYDDYLIFVSLVLALAVVASTLVMVHFGLGRHINLVTNAQGLAKSVLASQVLYALSVVPIKLSILALYLRLFPAPRLRIAAYCIGSVVLAYSFALAMCMGLQCIPLSHIWKPETPAVCFNATAMYITMAVVNVITDFAILGLPIPYIWGLSMQKARKIQLIAVFLLGALVCAFGIIRAVAVSTASIHDQSWNDVDGAVWSEVEICIGVVSANLPCLRPIFYWLPSAIRGSTNTPRQSNVKGGPPSYGRSPARQSPSAGFELSVRSRMTGDGWERMDGTEDGILSTIEEKSASRTEAGASPVDDAPNNPTKEATEVRGRYLERASPSIRVETTIETHHEPIQQNNDRK